MTKDFHSIKTHLEENEKKPQNGRQQKDGQET